ncbi:MAG: acetyl-CoA carboxylase carboxyltransferase subunit alpha, partial [Acetobacteraceae bacterium]
MQTFLEFEKPIAELEGKIEELRHLTDAGDLNSADEVGKLQAKVEKLLQTTYAKLTPAQKVQVARHPNRPHALDYISALVTDFTPLAGDRAFAEDGAIIGGLGRFRGRSVVVIGQEKGHDTETRVKHNFGMAKPEGYRKAQRLMDLAARFHLPVVTLVDTAGAYPGVGAEERGQAEAIAVNMLEMSRLRTPIVSIIIGEGGSGGALGIAVADRVAMLQHAWYSVISPEGCAAILWKEANEQTNTAAAKSLKLTASDNIELGIIDDVIEEPLGGAHRNPKAMASDLADW